MFIGRLTTLPDAWDRYYGRDVAAALLELLGLMTEYALKGEEEARHLKGYGMTDVLPGRKDNERSEKAAQALLAFMPQRVGQMKGRLYATVTAALVTKKSLKLKLTTPAHESERQQRNRPEKSYILASAALMAILEEICATEDYETVVIPTLRAVQERLAEAA